MAHHNHERTVHLYRWLMGAGVMLILAAFVLLGLSFTGVVGVDNCSVSPPSAGPDLSDATTSTGFSLEEDGERLREMADAWGTPGVPSEAAPDGAPDAVPDAPPGAAPDAPPQAMPPKVAPVRLAIPKIGVEAPVVLVGVDGDGIMQSPSGPFEVGWYGFTGQPGSGGNAVFSGHVDFANVGPAVFWHLRELGLGDLIDVRLSDGTAYQYVVTSSASYDADDAPIAEIVGPTPKDTVTLITCAGTFNRDVRQYSDRLVVRAERL